MKATIVESSFGMLAFNEENKLIEKVLFRREPQTAAKTVLKIESGKLADEVAHLIELLKKKSYDTFVFESLSLAKEAQNKLGVNAEVSKSSEAAELLRSNMERFAVETGFVKDSDDFTLWMHNVTMEITKQRVRGAVEKKTCSLVRQSKRSMTWTRS